jgi:Raf kinase inhibitor-like YbhB/YbcL family protein
VSAARTWAAVAVVATAGVLGGCGGSGHTSSVPSAGPDAALRALPIRVTSPAFADGAAIPRQYTCDGRDVSPPLRWSGVTRAASRLDLTMRDPDAPGGNFTHWSVTGIPTTIVAAQAGVPPPGIEGRNGFGTVGYRGPCPPAGDKPHHYVITITAIYRSTTVATGQLVGTYARG